MTPPESTPKPDASVEERDDPSTGKRHTLTDHQYGAEYEHSHDDDADHDHDHDNFSGDDASQESLWRQDNVILHSVGIDVGSSGTQVVFSKIHLRRIAEDLSSRYTVVDRQPVYQSPISLTPYTSETTMDAKALACTPIKSTRVR